MGKFINIYFLLLTRTLCATDMNDVTGYTGCLNLAQNRNYDLQIHKNRLTLGCQPLSNTLITSKNPIRNQIGQPGKHLATPLPINCLVTT